MTGDVTHLVPVIVGKDFAGMSSLNTSAVDKNADLVTVCENLGNKCSDRLLR